MIDGAGDEVLYQEGDALGSTGVTLLSIKGDRIILNNKGDIEELTLDTDSMTKLAWIESSDDVSASGTFEGVFSTNLLGGGKPVKARSVDSKEEKFLDRVSLSIIKSEAGTIVGYKLAADLDTLASFNLQSGDILVGVNGKRMTSPLQALAMGHVLRGSTAVELMIERDGKIENITINK